MYTISLILMLYSFCFHFLFLELYFYDTLDIYRIYLELKSWDIIVALVKVVFKGKNLVCFVLTHISTIPQEAGQNNEDNYVGKA